MCLQRAVVESCCDTNGVSELSQAKALLREPRQKFMFSVADPVQEASERSVRGPGYAQNVLREARHASETVARNVSSLAPSRILTKTELVENVPSLETSYFLRRPI